MQLYGSHILLFRLEVHSMASMPSANNLVVIAKDASYTAVVECTYAVVCGHLSCAVLEMYLYLRRHAYIYTYMCV